MVHALLWIAYRVPSETLSAWLIGRAIALSQRKVQKMSGDWHEEVRKMAPPSDEEIAEWADGVVHGKTPSGVDVYFDVKARAWRKVRTMGPFANSHWPQGSD